MIIRIARSITNRYRKARKKLAGHLFGCLLTLLAVSQIGLGQSSLPSSGSALPPGAPANADAIGFSSVLQRQSETSADTNAQSLSPTPGRDGFAADPNGVMGSAGSLSTSQIIAVLQSQPDALTELKQYVSDAAAKQGAPIQADAITDDMLFTRIASSAALRSNITVFLHARGYVSDADLEESAGSRSEQDAISGPRLQNQPKFNGGIPSVNGYGTSMSPGNPFNDPRSLSDSGFPRMSIPSARSSKQPKDEPTSTSEPHVLHRPAPYNLRSLHDLYAQLPEQTEPLKRFGSDMFLQRNVFAGAIGNQLNPSVRETPLDVPAGPSYVVGPGDSLQIDMWGGISQSFTRAVDREGRIALPESGAVQVAGLTLDRVQGVLTDALKQQYRSIQVAVTVAHLRSIRVFVVGDVQRPGAYDISSLSTPLNALYAAGGPTAAGSLRMLRHYRGKLLVGEIDLYDFLLHGVQVEDRLEAGDSVLVPPTGPQIAVYGAVKRPAIYELKADASMADALSEAGGATVAAELGQIEIERIDTHQQRETLSLPILPGGSDPESTKAAMAAFHVQDGDRVRVSSILPYSQRVVYIQGHVVRPGRVAYHDGMRINDVLRSYRDLLPEPADRAEVVRLVAPDLHVETIDFNLPEALIGNSDLSLQPFDTIRIYGRYESDAPTVVIGGEVLRPGTYSLSSGMTAAGLVRMAGGFKRDALLENADLTSYRIINGTKVISERASIEIGNAVIREDKRSDVPLKPGDVLTVHQITGWNDIGASISLDGEVAHPGSYGIQQGEHLSSILRRAGGMRDTAYAAGAVLLRDDVKALEEKSREELIKQIETSATAARMRPSLGAGDQSATLQLISQQQEQVLARLKSQPAVGRLVIHISADISSWENTPADIEVRAGDVLRIPKRPGFILVSGQVYNTSAITFSEDKSAGWYLKRAGGTTEIANNRDIFIIRANGSVVGRGSGSFLNHDVLGTRLDPGDVVVVPQKILGASVFWRNLLTVAQLSSSIAITAAVAGIL